MDDVWAALRGPVQIAYAVDDVVAAATACVGRGAGPFFIREHIAVTNARVHGQSRDFDHSSAYGQWGDLMVELICEHHADSERIGPTHGVHHMAFLVDQVASAQAVLIAAGWTEALYAEAGQTAFAMHDARSELGHLIEVYAESPGLTSFYTMVREAAESWDGTNPIRVP